MATESPIRMLESDESKKWIPTMDSALFSSPFSTFVDHEAVSKVFKGNAVLEEQIRAVPSRSGSAPPTIEGSLAAFQAFMEQRNSTLPTSRNDFLDCESEEQMRTDPAYISYYYANVNLNPRLPPPLISRENRNLMQFMGGFGGKNISVSKGLLDTHKEEPEESASPSKISDDPKENCAHDANVTSLAGHNGSNVDLMEGGFIQAPSSSSSTAVKGGNAHDIDTVSTTDQTLNMQESCSVSVGVHIMNSSTNSSASTVSNCRNLNLEDNVSTQSNIGSDASVVESRMKLLDVSDGVTRNHDQKRHDNIQLHHENRNLPHPSPDTTYQLPGFQAYPIPRAPYAVHQKVLPVHQSFIPNSGMVPPLYASTAAYMNPGNLFYPGVPQPGFPPSPQYALGETSMHSIFHPNFTGHLQDNAFPLPIDAYSKAAFFKQPIEVSPNPYTSQVLRPPFGGSLQGQSFQPLYEDARRIAVQCQLDALASQNDFFAASSIADKELSHRAIENLRSSPPTSMPHIRVSYGYPPNLGEPRFSAPSAISGSSIPRNIHQGLQNDLSASLHSSKDATVFSGGKGERGPESSDSSKRHSILELIKSSSSRTLELSVLSGHIVEFSTDQHGSRFIQQKLENCSSEEKESVFKEVFPQASRLMTDVFGNYVVQKFFEHGSEEQRRSLGQQLTGQVLTLSLQMYGCRVIQKALDVIELDQKVELIKELDGHVIRCVHDQNGNHVIQKCIESVPTEKIKFITSSFAGKVATLSCHPYGCRVIQRVLEHCSDEQLTHWIVDEILESTSTLAHDPYGNYVTQHVMEMGKPHQRSQIIQKLTGQFVQLSQHKFASNVVEKCIKYGNDSERDLIIEEIIAPSDNNEALLMMIKDQFANYVVQKVFEIGSEKQKETLQNCIQLHLPALKKVSYAKHIVSRYEQLAEGSIQEKNQCEKVDD